MSYCVGSRVRALPDYYRPIFPPAMVSYDMLGNTSTWQIARIDCNYDRCVDERNTVDYKENTEPSHLCYINHTGKPPGGVPVLRSCNRCFFQDAACNQSDGRLVGTKREAATRDMTTAKQNKSR